MKRIILIILLAILMLFSISKIICYLWDQQETAKDFQDLNSLIEQPPTTSPQPTETEHPVWTVLDQYGMLFEQNSDMIGWISIEGTTINYPVMHTPDNPDFYLKRNFERQYSSYGVPYMDYKCSIEPQSDNVVIYGHHMKNETMFAPLESYKNKTFYQEHSIIKFDTLSGFGQYVILAVFKVYASDFPYHLFVDAQDENAFDEYISRCKKLSFYETGVTAEYGDKLITLSTCEYSRKNNRLVVVAKQVQEP